MYTKEQSRSWMITGWARYYAFYTVMWGSILEGVVIPWRGSRKNILTADDFYALVYQLIDWRMARVDYAMQKYNPPRKYSKEEMDERRRRMQFVRKALETYDLSSTVYNSTVQ